MKRRIALIHAVPAAIGAVVQYYSEAAPELDLYNLLDDGLTRLFALDDPAPAHRRLADMIATARDIYRAELALLTCSAVPRPTLDALRADAGIPVLKIDEPLAQAAVKAGRRLGVIVTFPPTVETARRLLLDADPAVELTIELVPNLAAVRGAAERLAAHDAIVLAQVSMAPLAADLRRRLAIPIFTSLDTSLPAVREALL